MIFELNQFTFNIIASYSKHVIRHPQIILYRPYNHPFLITARQSIDSCQNQLSSVVCSWHHWVPLLTGKSLTPALSIIVSCHYLDSSTSHLSLSWTLVKNPISTLFFIPGRQRRIDELCCCPLWRSQVRPGAGTAHQRNRRNWLTWSLAGAVHRTAQLGLIWRTCCCRSWNLVFHLPCQINPIQ